MNKKTGRLVLLLFFSAAVSVAIHSCSKEQVTVSLVSPPNCDSAEVSYQQEIIQIMNNSCAYSPCHVPGSGNYDFTRYEVLADRIRAGRLEERLLISTGNPLHMPQGYTLDECQLYKLRLWIHQGFKNN